MNFNEKNFDTWNKRKKELAQNEKQFGFYEREIWITYVGINLGTEQNGNEKTFVRPVLILKKYNSEQFLAIPLTSKEKNGKYVFPLGNLTFLHHSSWILLSQLRTFDKKRLYRRIGKIPHKLFEIIQKKTAEHSCSASGA